MFRVQLLFFVVAYRNKSSGSIDFLVVVVRMQMCFLGTALCRLPTAMTTLTDRLSGAHMHGSESTYSFRWLFTRYSLPDWSSKMCVCVCIEQITIITFVWNRLTAPSRYAFILKLPDNLVWFWILRQHCGRRIIDDARLIVLRWSLCTA